MRSIDDLKDYVRSSYSYEMQFETSYGEKCPVRVVMCDKEHIIDLIKKVESEVKELFGSNLGVGEAILFSERVKEAVRNGDDVTLFGVDYMPLPVDKQGHVIRPGDTVYVTGLLNPHKVMGVGRRLGGEPPEVWLSNGIWESASRIEIHATQPSPVEEMLGEMCDRLDEPKGEDLHKSVDEIIGEYAARLKLKEEE